MIIKRNNMPKVTIFKHKDVMDSYVSRNETNGIITAITDKIDNHIQMVDNNIGFEYCEVPREAITEIEKNIFKRDPLVENITGLDKRVDSSMSNDNIISFDKCNNIIGMITSDNMDINYESTSYTGVHSELYGKISYNNKEINSIITNKITKYNPFCEFNLTDIVKSFIINDIIYSIHRGGYITIYTIETKTTKIVSFIEEFSLYDEIPIKNNDYFDKIEFSNVVTNVATNNEMIVITTTSNSILFNTLTETYNILPLTINGETIIEIQFYNNFIYYITNTNDKNYKIFKYNIITSEKDEITITNKDSIFFPNTITKIGNDIIIYESISKFGKHLTTDIEYIHIVNESDLATIIKIQLNFPVSARFISGSLTEMYVNVTSDEELFDNSLIFINSTDKKLYNKNINIFDEDIKEVFHDNSSIISFSNNNIYYISLDSITNEINYINKYDLIKNRNSGKYIIDCTVNEEKCIVTFDDNTQIIIDINTINSNNNIYTIKNNSLLSIINNEIQTFIKNDKLYTIIDNSIDSLVITPHTQIFTNDEFDSISLLFSNNINETDSNFIIITNGDSFTRITMFSLIYTIGIPTLTVLNNHGIGSILTSDSNLVRILNNKILLPINPEETSKTFLIVCDFDKNIFIRNVLSTPLSNYTKTLFISIDNTDINFSIGIDTTVYRTSNIESLLSTDGDVSIIQNIENDIFINNSLETINTNTVLCSYATINKLEFIDKLLTINNIIIDNNPSKIIKLGIDYIFISKKDIKIYNYEFLLKSVFKNDLNTDNVINIQKISDYIYILFTNNGTIYIDLTNIDEKELSSIIYENKDMEYIKNSGLIGICDNSTISIIDTINIINYYDIINNVNTSINKQFNIQLHRFKIDSIERINSSIYVSISYFDKIDNYYLGSFVINIFNSTVDLIELNNIEIQNNTKYIDTNYSDMVLIDDNLYILFYNNDKISCKIINIDTFIDTDIDTIYSIPSGTFYSGMIATEDDLYILTTDGVVDITTYEEKVHIEPSLPVLAEYYKINIINKEKFNILKIDNTNLKINFKSKNLDNDLLINFIKDSDNPYSFQFLIDNFINLRISVNDSEVYICNTDTFECIMMNIDTIYSFINGYKLFNIMKNEEFYSNTFFNYFTNGFVSFNNYSGLYNEFYNKQYTTIGDFINDKEVIFIDYKLNKYSCIKNNMFPILVNIDKYSNDFISIRILSSLYITKQINYCFDNDKIIFTDSKYLNKENDEITLLNNIPISSESYHYKEFENECKVILNKEDDNIFGYNQCIFIDSLNSVFSIDMISGLEIKPIYVDNNDILHSIIKNGNNTYYLNGINENDAVLIQDFNNVVDAVKVQDIDNLILLINNEGKVIVYNTVTLEYKNITFVNDCIIGLPDNYSFERIINLSDNYTCVIIVKNKQTNNYHLIPNCKITLTLDSFENPVFEVNTTTIGIIKSFYINNIMINSFNIPTTNLITGLNFNSCIKTIESVNYDININVSIGNITIDGNLIDNINNFTHTYITDNKIIDPKIFIRDRYFIIQYSKKIIICQLIDRFIPDFIPLYEITQNNYGKTKIITDVMISGRNILFTFSDKTCRVVNVIGALNDSNEQVTFFDNGFKYYTEYKINSSNIDLKTFVTESGYVGYFTDNLIYIFKKGENRFINIPTTTMVKYFCIDTLYNRVYCIDDKNNFGYIDIINYRYIPIKALTDMNVINIVYTVFNTVEILTTIGVLIYMNENLYKLTDREPDGKEIIIYPYKSYSN